MAEQTEILNLTINLESAESNIANLTEEVTKAKQALDEFGKTPDKNDAAWMKANATYKALNTELTNQTKYLATATAEQNSNIAAIKKANSSITPLSARLKDMTLQLQKMAAEGKSGTAEFIALAKEAGTLKNAINVANDQINTFATGGALEYNINAAVEGFNAIAGAGQLVTGSMSVLGIGNEDTAKSIEKMVAFSSLASGAQKLWNSLTKEGALITKVYAAGQYIAAAATKAWTWATNGASTSLKALKVALISTGIGAFVVALGAIVAYWDKISAFFGGAGAKAAATNKILETQTRLYDNLIKQHDSLLQYYKSTGADLEKIFEQEDKIYKLKKDQHDLVLATLEAQAKDKSFKKQAELDAARARSTELKLERLLLEESKKTRLAERQMELNREEITNIQLIAKERDKTRLSAEQNRDAEKKDIDDIYELEKKNIDEKYKTQAKNAKNILAKNNEIKALELKYKDDIDAIDKEYAQARVNRMQNELDIYNVKNKSLLEGIVELNDDIIAAEFERINKVNAEELKINQYKYKNKLIDAEQYALNVVNIEAKSTNSINTLNDKVFSYKLDNMRQDLEQWELANKSKLEDVVELNDQIIIDEKARLKEQYDMTVDIYKAQLDAKQITQKQFNAAEAQAFQTQIDGMIIADEKYLQYKKDNAQSIVDLQNAQTENFEITSQIEIDAAQRAGMSIIEMTIARNNKLKEMRLADLEAQYNLDISNKTLTQQQKLALDQQYENDKLKISQEAADAEFEIYERSAKAKADLNYTIAQNTLSTASGLAKSLSSLAEQGSKKQKDIAAAAATIDALASANAAFRSMASIPTAGPVLGAFAAASALAAGYANVKKIYATSPGSKSSLSSTSSTSSTSSSVGSAIVSQNTTVTRPSEKTTTVLVVDSVTAKQQSQSTINKTSNI